jgi:hypothetical protein
MKKLLFGALALFLLVSAAYAQVPPPWGLVVSTPALTNTVTSIKKSPGQLANVLCYNPNVAVTYVVFFNALVANVTLGTTLPWYIVPIPPSLNGGYAQSTGLAFAPGLSYAAVTTPTGGAAPVTAITCSIGAN